MTIRMTLLSSAAAVAFGLFAVCAPASAQLFGGSNNNAAPAGDDIDQRLDRLENSLRQLTGAIEQLQYRNQQLEQRINGMGGAAAPQAPAAGPAPSLPRRHRPRRHRERRQHQRRAAAAPTPLIPMPILMRPVCPAFSAAPPRCHQMDRSVLPVDARPARRSILEPAIRPAYCLRRRSGAGPRSPATT